MSVKFCSYFILLFLSSYSVFAQNYKVLESTSDYIKLEFDFQNSFIVKDTVIEGKNFNYIAGQSNGVRKYRCSLASGSCNKFRNSLQFSPANQYLNVEKIIT